MNKMLIKFWKLKIPPLEIFVLPCWTKGFFVCVLIFLCFEISLQVFLEAEDFDYMSFKFREGLLK